MRSFLKIAFVLAFVFSGLQQGVAQNNVTPATKNFNRCIKSMKATSNFRIRYNNALAHFKFKPSTTKQLAQACFLLASDKEKFELCKAAYPKIVDKQNFYIIYDSFSTFSNALRLYHHTEGAAGPGSNATVNNNNQNNQQIKKATFNELIQKGDDLMKAKRYNVAISTYEEAQALKPKNRLVALKLKEARRIKKKQKEATIKEKVKFEMLIEQGDEYLEAKLFDRAIVKYEQALALKPNNKLALMKIQEANNRKDGHYQDTVLVQVQCIVSDAEFKQIKKSIKDQVFPDRQKLMAKQYISKKCFSTEQYKSILSIFYMDSDKLELIKHLYDFTNQPDEMYMFRDTLGFLGTKREFDKFLLEKQ